MPEDRVGAVLRSAFGEAVDPDPAFADRLYGLLSSEVGFGPARSRWLPIPGPFGRPLAIGPQLRAAWLVVIMALLGLAAIAGLIASQLLLQRSAEDIVRASQEVFGKPPPFAMVVRYADGRVARYAHDGAGTSRAESIEGPLFAELPAGSWMIQGPAGRGWYDPVSRLWTTSDEPSPYPLWSAPFSWVPPVGVPAGQAPPLYKCDSWQRLPDDTVIGRPAYRVACGSREFWIDRESHLLVRVVDPELSPQVNSELVEFTLETQPAELFALAVPQGAHTEEDIPPSTKLVVGQRAPPLRGELIHGGSFDAATLLGRPTAVYFWCSCAPGPSLRHLTEEVRGRDGAVNLAVIAVAERGTTVGAIEDLGILAPVVLDTDWELLGDWGMAGAPALVLLDSSGAVRATHLGRFTRAEIGAMLEALVAGAPIPEPMPPSPLPDDALSTVLVVGELPPDWAAPRLDGGTLSVSELRGRPAVLYFWPSNFWTSEGEEGSEARRPVEDVVAAWQPFEDDLALVLVASGEQTPGAIRDWLVERQLAVPVVVDWIGERWLLWGFIRSHEIVLLDAEGRVATYTAGCCPTRADLEPLFDDLVGGRPLPSPRGFRQEG